MGTFKLSEHVKTYQGSFVKDADYDEELDITGIESAHVQISEFRQDDGSYTSRPTMVFELTDGSKQFMALSRDSKLADGDEVDLDEPISIIRLTRGKGREDDFDEQGNNRTHYNEVVYRVDGVALEDDEPEEEPEEKPKKTRKRAK
jgi:hypothetical protein